jgi:hypothetical protein
MDSRFLEQASARKILASRQLETLVCGIAPSFPLEYCCVADREQNINRLIVQFAHRNVYSHVESEEVRVLVDPEIDIIIVGENGFLPPNN